MDIPPSREALLQRIADLEDELLSLRKNQETIRSSKGFGFADFEHAADGICVCHAIDEFPFVRFTFWNQRMVDLCGYDLEEINRKGWYQSVYPDPEVQARAIARMAQMREGANLEAEMWEITRADGHKRTLRISTSVLDHGDEKPRVMAIMHDVTQLKHTQVALKRRLADADHALKTSDAKYRNLFDNAGDALFIENDRDEILDVNKQACKLLGYSREELLSMKICDIQAPAYRGKSGCVLSKEIADYQGKTFETMDLHKDGFPIPVEVTNNRLDEAGLYLSIVRDIRDRKAAEQSLRETFDIIEKSPVAAFLWRNETDWPIEFVTRNVGRIFGYSDTDFSSGRIHYSNVVHPDDLDRVAHEVATCSQDSGRTAFTHEPYRIVAKDSSIRWVNDQTFIRRDHTGAITHFQGIVEDITARVVAEQALQESEEKFSRAFHSSPDAIVISRLKGGRILDINEGFTNFSGYGRGEIIGRTTADLNLWTEPLDRKHYLQMMTEKGQVRNYEHRFRVKSGEFREGLLSGEIVRIGSEEYLLGTIRDITERKQAEAEVLREKHFSEMLINQLPGSFYMFTENGSMIRWNDNLLKVTGYSDADIQQMNALDFFPEDEKDQVRIRIREVFEQGVSQVEANFLAKNGHKIPHKLTGARMEYDGITYLLGVGLDITDDKQIQDALRESEERFRQIAENIREVFWLFDWQAKRVLYVSPGYDRIWGRSRENLYACYEEWGESIHPEDVPYAHKSFNSILETGGGEPREYRIVRPDGAERWISDTGYAIKDSQGNVVRITGIAEDITQRKHTEEALNREKNRLAVTLRSIGDAVITTDSEGRIVLMNPIAEDFTGWNEADAIGRPLMNVFRIVNERTGEPCANPVDRVLSTGKIVDLANHTMLVAKNGREYIIADSGAPILDLQGEIIGVILVFRDITGQQRIEKELLKMEKLKSLGVLAGGIAHDFNNFLTGIIGNLSLAKLDIQPGNPVSRAIDEMEKAAVRAKDLTQQLLTFSKGGEPVKHITRIADLIGESARFALRGSNVRCQFSIDEGLLPAVVDEGQIAQVVHNLIINADQAMPNGGTVLIKGINLTLSPDNPYALDPGCYIQLSIHDEGMGIHPDHIKKVFDPYFTTKQKGSGLGLAVAYSIIVKHDGQLTVDSKLGQGTTFTILLPASESTQVEDIKEAKGLIIGGGRILVMDDEDFIRDLVSVMLHKMGYEVALAQDGQAAVDIYKEAFEAGNPFDAVILDLTVPGGMGGKETVRHLATLDSTVRAIVSSGYSNDPVMADHANYGFCGAVKKPYLVQEMSQVLNTVIKKQEPRNN